MNCNRECVICLALRDKLANLTLMHDNVKKSTAERTAALENTLGISEDFWTAVDDLKYEIEEMGGTLSSQSKPALDPDHIKEQQEELKVRPDYFIQLCQLM